jgi:hypothetical protein
MLSVVAECRMQKWRMMEDEDSMELKEREHTALTDIDGCPALLLLLLVKVKLILQLRTLGKIKNVTSLNVNLIKNFVQKIKSNIWVKNSLQ